MAVDMFRAVGDGRIKAIWIIATNPVDSLPEADAVRKALDGCPFVVVSDVARDTDTAACADILLPAAAWGEKDGTVTNSERSISRQRRFRPPPGEARPDWWIVAEVARRMGFSPAFDYARPAAIFREHAALSAAGNNGSRAFDIGGLGDISDEDYADMAPVQWPVPRAGRPGGRFFGDRRFYTPNKRARFVPVGSEPPGAPRDPRHPLILNSGRVRDHWHTLTRTGQSPRLSAHIAEPFVEIHPDDAAAAGIGDAELAVVESRHGRAVVRALLTGAQQRGSVFMPMHWTDQFASAGRVDALVDSAADPWSGQPGLKSGRVSVRSFGAAWYGFAVLADRPRMIAADYWALARAKGGWRIELAGAQDPDDWDQYAAGLFSASAASDVASFRDRRSGAYRFAAFAGDSLVGALFVAADPVAVSRAFVAGQLGANMPPEQRWQHLAGRAGAEGEDRGAILCSCFEIGDRQIADAVVNRGCMTVEAVGMALGAGTNCGSCRPEIRRVIGRLAAAVEPEPA
jgi:assimilatory nitrate reductase catalytic subunit